MRLNKEIIGNETQKRRATRSRHEMEKVWLAERTRIVRSILKEAAVKKWGDHMGRDHYLFKKASLVQLFRGIYGLREPTPRTTVDDIVTDILGGIRHSLMNSRYCHSLKTFIPLKGTY